MIDAQDKKRLANESYSDYYQRLLESSHKADEAKQTHETWKRRHWDGITLGDCKHRILVVLRELLKSDFFRPDYFDTGVPKADRMRAQSDLTAMGFYDLDDPVEGADWKYALFCRVLRKRGEKRILIDKEAAGLYIDEMRNELDNDAIEAFFRFAMFAKLAYEEIDKFEDTDVVGAIKDNHEPKESPEQMAVKSFVAKLNRLASDAYDIYNGKSVIPAVHQAEVKVIIERDKLKSRLESKMRCDFDELKALCYPPNSKTKQNLCSYVVQLQKDGFFGKLPNNKLAELLAPIVGLSNGTVTNYLSQA